MGAEEFRVRVETARPAPTVAALLLALPHVRPGKWEDTFVYEDESFILRIFMTPGEPTTTVRVGFALCQEASVDDFYAGFVLSVATLVEASSVIVEGQQPAVFRPDWAGLRDHILTSIVEPRRLWQLEFGAETAKLGCDDAMRVYAMGLEPEHAAPTR